MNVLLDTCALLALARGKLPNAAAAALRTPTVACISVVSPWEVTIGGNSIFPRERDLYAVEVGSSGVITSRSFHILARSFEAILTTL
jgi:hypothetical protein